MKSQYMIEYLNDVSLYLDTIHVGIEIVERYMLCQATNDIQAGMRFGKIRRAMQRLDDERNPDLTKVKFELAMLKQQIAELRGTLKKVAA